MGLLVGALFGVGLVLCLFEFAQTTVRPLTLVRRRRRASLGEAAGLPGWRPARVLAASAGAGLLAAAVVLAATRVSSLALAFGLLAAAAPRGWLRARAQARLAARRELWPDVVDNLTSAVRAGLALPEALAELGERGPAQLRPAFVAFARGYRVNGSFPAALDQLGADLDDPVADRVVEALRLVREVGGSDLGVLLRSLSAFLREDARVRAEVRARQSWTVSAARLALVAPWAVLLLLASQASTIDAYNRPGGALVLAVGGAVSWLAYRLMRRVGRLPEPGRG